MLIPPSLSPFLSSSLLPFLAPIAYVEISGIWGQIEIHFRLGVKLELQLLAYTTATAAPDPSHVCDLHHVSQQRQILNPLNRARTRTHILMNTSQVHYFWVTMGSPDLFLIYLPLREDCPEEAKEPFIWATGSSV